MRVSSFDIFDTCLIRKCGTPANFFDVFSLRAFKGEVPEWARQELVAVRRKAEMDICSASTTLNDIWETFDWSHPLSKPKSELRLLEQDLEREMLVPVLRMRDRVNKCRQKGDKIIFISDMYLPSFFLKEVMHNLGFYQEGDSLYVSCECQAAKYDGSLFRYVKEKEGVSFHNWHHYGDNEYVDCIIPKKLGIKTTLIQHSYTPYQQKWIDNDFSLTFKYSSILAGIGRALHHNTQWTTHTDFVLDIIAPFYCSLVYRMLKDAEQRGIQRIYFCARDAYMMYLVAEKYKPFFPSIECKFLYISRTSLYEGDERAKMAYFTQEGLVSKTDNVAIADIRSSGLTLQQLNKRICAAGGKAIRGYYFEVFTTNDLSYISQDYYAEVNGIYIKNAKNFGRFIEYRSIYEQFLPLNTLKRTIGYSIDDKGKAAPVFDDKDESEFITKDCFRADNLAYWAELHKNLIMDFVDEYINTGLYLYSDKIFETISVPTLTEFMTYPNKKYLSALTDFYSYSHRDHRMVPYVKRLSWWELLFKRGRVGNIWKRASIIYTLPEWLTTFIISMRHKNQSY